MKPFPVLPFSGISPGSWAASEPQPVRRAPTAAVANGPAGNSRATTTTAAFRLVFCLGGPGEQSENQEEDADDLELESDEDPSKLRIARARPGTEDGSPAARDDDGTINPPFP